MASRRVWGCVAEVVVLVVSTFVVIIIIIIAVVVLVVVCSVVVGLLEDMAVAEVPFLFVCYLCSYLG